MLSFRIKKNTTMKKIFIINYVTLQITFAFMHKKTVYIIRRH